MEENELTKVAFAKNLDKVTFSTLVSANVDTNVNIKTILDISSYLFDTKVECGSGKAVFNGKVGLKVVYVDTDNLTNTLTDSQSFSETFFDSAIVPEAFINMCDNNLVNNVLSTEGVLKVNCEVSVTPVMYLNLAVNNKAGSFENMIVRKSELSTSVISNKFDTNFDYTTNFETKDKVSKILYVDSYFACEKVESFSDYAVVEGKIMSKLIYETGGETENEIKELCDTFPVKTDIALAGLNKEDVLDVSCIEDISKQNVSTDLDDGETQIAVTHCFKFCGVAITKMTIEIVDDMYSTENELELSHASREFYREARKERCEETVTGEFSIDENEPAIDCVVANLNIQPEMIKTYVKDGSLFVEGIITSCAVYLDENKNYVRKLTELPFSFDTKIKVDDGDCAHTKIAVCSNKCKAKRGTIIELEYTLAVCAVIYVKESRDLIDSMTLGKALNLGEYDYQIFIAKPNESMWDLCKRIKISPDDIIKTNKDLPQVMTGTEKIVIKR